jgi:hypothetical protein
VILRPNIYIQGICMGLLRGLLGRNDLKAFLGKDEGGNGPNRVLKPSLTPEYERLNVWIESRIGRMDPSDPNLNAKLDRLLSEERSKYPSPQGKLVFAPSGNDTIVTGDTKPFKGRLRKLGGKWEGNLKRWVIKNKGVTEADVENPGEIAGLKAYINKMPYRKNLGGQ